MKLQTSKESEKRDKSVGKDSIIRLVEKINWEYSEILKELAKLESREKEGEEAK